MSFSSKRWQKDLTKLLRSEFKVEMINDDMQEVYVEFHGPKDCPYCGGVWRVRAALPDAYPHKSPSIGFVNKIYHPNIDEMSGAVSLTVIDHVWNPMFDLVKVFEEILPQLILFPNPSDSMNEEAAALMMRDKNTYEQRVKEYCKKYAKTEDAGVASNENTSNEEPSVVDSRKRKRESESFSGMLNWLHHVAIHSDDPVIGSIPESSKWRDSGNKEFWVQALLAREALSKRWHSSRNAGEHLQSEQQKKPRMHPTMYEDNVLDHQWTEKRRCSKRTRSVKKPPLCPCCNSRENRKSKDFNDHHHRGRNHPKALKHSVTKIKKIATNMNNRKFFETPPVKEVSVGPSHQANVPEWTGVISESDPKWLGIRMWPPENNNGKLIANITENWNRHSCTCPFPASVECVRFHIAEKRLELNRELGSLFHSWRFDRMGEEVSLSWSKEEEKIFRDLMRSKAPILDKVPKNGLKLLLYKTREKLVSYYFNVYLVQRKSYQNRVTPNRVTPKGVDSDDEAIECGIIGDSFGYKALDVPGLSTSVVCTLNEEDFSALE